MKRSALLAVLLFLLLHHTQAWCRQYTVSHKLISNTVYKSFTDRRGYLWFGTDRGVARYDGHSFKNYTLANGIGDNDVFNFYEDREGRLWLFTFNGNYCFIRNDSVFNTGNDPVLKKLPAFSTIHTMLNVDDTTLFIGYRQGGIVCLKGNNAEIISAAIPSSNGGKREWEVTELFYTSGNTVKALTLKETKTIAGNKILHKNPLVRGGPSCFFYGAVYTADETCLKVYRRDTLITQYTDPRLNWNNIISIYVNKEGFIFCSTTTGILVIDPKTKKYSVILPNVWVSSVNQDARGNYWITTIGNGIYCFNEAFRSIRLLSNNTFEKTVYTTNHQVFFLNEHQLFVFPPGSSTLQKLPYYFRTSVEPLYYSPFFLLYRDSAYDLRYTTPVGRMNIDKRIDGNAVKNIFECDKKKLIILKSSGNRYTLYNVTPGSNSILLNHSLLFKERIIDASYNGNNKQFYILTKSTLYQYNPYNYQLKILDYFKGFSPISILFIGNNLVVQRNDKSSCIYNTEKGNSRRAAQFDIVIYATYELKGGQYLIKSDKGYLVSSLPKNDTLPVFTAVEYPFSNAEIAEMYPVNDSIICNTDNQLYIFDQRLLNQKLYKPPLFIDKIMVDSTGYKTTSISVKNLAVCHVALTLNTLYSDNPDGYYQYKIETHNDAGQWYKSGSNKIDLLLSKYGLYKIHLRAVSENGIPSVTRTVSIQLLPPFYYSWWFILCEALVGIGIIFSAVYWYNKRRKIVFEEELEYMQLEYKSVNSLLNPHFIFNAINNIQSLVNEQKGEKANEYLHLLSKLIRQNMENLQFTLILLDKEIELVFHYIYLQNLRFHNRITFNIHNHIPANDNCKVPPLLIHTFVENAIVHGYRNDLENFTINLHIDLSTDDYLIIKLTDNGVGYDHAQTNRGHLNDKTSLGIDSIIKRLERISAFKKLDYSVTIADRAASGGQGTEVIVILYARFSGFIK